jgi:hypothetical protein
MAISKDPDTAKKAASRTRAPRAKAATTRAAGQGKKTAPPIEVSAEERWRMIAVAAYHKAEQRGFTPDGAMDDWLEAEKEVDMLIGGNK